MKMFSTIFATFLMCAGCVTDFGPQKPLNLQVRLVNSAGQPCDDNLDGGKVRLLESADPDETDPTKLNVMGEATIETPTGFDDEGNPLVYQFLDIDQTDMGEGLHYFRSQIVDKANNVSGVSTALEDRLDKTPPDTSVAPEKVKE